MPLSVLSTFSFNLFFTLNSSLTSHPTLSPSIFSLFLIYLSFLSFILYSYLLHLFLQYFFIYSSHIRLSFLSSHIPVSFSFSSFNIFYFPHISPYPFLLPIFRSPSPPHSSLLHSFSHCSSPILPQPLMTAPACHQTRIDMSGRASAKLLTCSPFFYILTGTGINRRLRKGMKNM